MVCRGRSFGVWQKPGQCAHPRQAVFHSTRLSILVLQELVRIKAQVGNGNVSKMETVQFLRMTFLKSSVVLIPRFSVPLSTGGSGIRALAIQELAQLAPLQRLNQRNVCRENWKTKSIPRTTISPPTVYLTQSAQRPQRRISRESLIGILPSRPRTNCP